MSAAKPKRISLAGGKPKSAGSINPSRTISMIQAVIPPAWMASRPIASTKWFSSSAAR